MKENIIGRRHEMHELEEAMDSPKAQFVVVYGRRRVGKTFLVKNFFENGFDFYTSGIFNGTKKEQLNFFIDQLRQYSGMRYPQVDNWFDAFAQLRDYLSGLNKDKVVVFIDELPWLDTHKSRFIQAFEAFWNCWGSEQRKLKLIVCGSATTWVVSKLFGAKGGLYNRIDRKIKLHPFCLGECEQFLLRRNIPMNRNQIIETYMTFGGIPYYLDLLPADSSLPQAIDQLFFHDGAALYEEFQFLFKSLFKDSSIYRRTIEALCAKGKGMTRAELQSVLKLQDGGQLTAVLENLEACDFIRKYYAIDKKERDAIYQLYDLFSLFYLKHVKGKGGRNPNYWSLKVNTAEYNAWSGYAFEQVCLHHLEQIRLGLGINGVINEACSWSCRPTDAHRGAQIDLVISRNDGVVNLCEIKYSQKEYEIDAEYEDTMLKRLDIFMSETGNKYIPHLTLITPKGLKEGRHSSSIRRIVTADALFHIPL